MTTGLSLWAVVVALAADAVIGDPPVLWRRLPHPVVLFGVLIGKLDAGLNLKAKPPAWRRAAGVIIIVVIVAAAAVTGAVIERLLLGLPAGWFLVGVIASVFIAQRSLFEHVARVRDALQRHGLVAGRKAVSMIVGRDPDSLDEGAVCRAAVESCAESISDGVVAPAFWFAVLGLPGLMAYKAVNTADSMIGHRDAKYESFGWAAARLDDGMNLLPARLSGVLIALAAVLVGGHPRAAFAVMWHDASLHRSPNAGWPEAAMAGALGVALAGPRRYKQEWVDDAFINASGLRNARPEHITQALRVLIAVCVLQLAGYALLAGWLG